MKSSEQLEREGDQTRACINETLDELRARVTPGQVLDQVVDYARATNGGALVRNLGRQVVENPLPLALIGTGLAWLMATDGQARRRRSTDFDASGSDFDTSRIRDAAGRAGDTAQDVARSTKEAANDVAERASSALSEAGAGIRDAAARTADAASSAVSEATAGVRDAAARSGDAASSTLSEAAASVRDAIERSGDAASSAIDSARSTATSRYERATRATRKATRSISDSSSGVVRTVQDRSQVIVDFCREQPLVVAGLGLALGAALGAALPISETEDRLVGEVSDDVKERMQRVASKAKENAKAAYDQVTEPPSGREEASHHGGGRSSSGDDGATRTPSLDDPMAMRGNAT